MTFSFKQKYSCRTNYLGAQESLNEKVTLKPCEKYDLENISNHDYQALANSTDGLQIMEDCINIWIRQIEQVIYVKNSYKSMPICFIFSLYIVYFFKPQNFDAVLIVVLKLQ